MTSEKIISQKPACKLVVIIVFTYNFKFAVNVSLATPLGLEPRHRISGYSEISNLLPYQIRLMAPYEVPS